MYPWLFRHLPGPAWMRALTCAALVGVGVATLVTWVVPGVAGHPPFTGATVAPPGGS